MAPVDGTTQEQPSVPPAGSGVSKAATNASASWSHFDMDFGLTAEGSQRTSLDLFAGHIAGKCSRRGGRLKDLVFVLLHDIQLFPAKLGHVLLVAGHTLHHAARTHPTPGHEHVLLEAIGSIVSEWIQGVRRCVQLW